MIINVTYQGDVYAVIIKSQYESEGIQFFTPDDYSQQLGYMKRPKDYQIEAHHHNLVPREVTLTNEVLIIKSGKVRIDFYNLNKEYFESWVLEKGDIILLAKGGHGFKMLEETEMVEVKQGPYVDQDKTRFPSVSEDQVRIKG